QAGGGDGLEDRLHLAVHARTDAVTTRRRDRSEVRHHELARDHDHHDPRRHEPEALERDERADDEELVRERIEERAEPRDLIEPAREPAIDGVAQRGDAEDREGPGRVALVGDLEEQHDRHDREHPRDDQADREVERHGELKERSVTCPTSPILPRSCPLNARNVAPAFPDRTVTLFPVNVRTFPFGKIVFVPGACAPSTVARIQASPPVIRTVTTAAVYETATARVSCTSAPVAVFAITRTVCGP